MSMIQVAKQKEPQQTTIPAELKKADRLRRSLEALLRSNRALKVIGVNHTVSQLAEQCGLTTTGYCQFDISVDGRRICLLCVPQIHWTRPSSMEAFNELRIVAGALGHRVLLAPEALVRDSYRLNAHKHRAAAPNFEISGTDRSAIIGFLLEKGSGTLAQLAGLLRHSDPVGAILYMGVIGAVDVDLDAAIMPATRVRLAAEVH